MTQIYIEDNELDIYEDLPNQITYSIDDITKLDTKTTSFSKTITLPGTNKNNKLFGNIFEVGNSNFPISGNPPNVFYNFNASKSAKARIDIDGMTIVKGVMRLLEIVVDETLIEYQVAIFGELGGLFANLGAKKLEELDFSAYNHAYNVTNIANSWDNANAGQGYFYPLIDYGNTSPATNTYFAKKSFYFTAFRPALFVREYLDKIIKGAGYTWESNFFNTDFFKRLVIPNNQIRFAFKKTRIFNGSPSGSVSLISFDTFKNVAIGNTSASFFTTSDNLTFTYTSPDTFNGVVNVQINGRFRFPDAAYNFFVSRTARFVIVKNGSVAIQEFTFGINYVTEIGGFAGSNQWIPFNFTYQYSPFIGTFSLSQNDTFSLALLTTSGVGTMQTEILSGTISLDGVPTFAPALYNDQVTINDTIPKGILQKDFFASIVKMFYLMITEDKYKDKHIKIEPFIDFYNVNPNSYIDWSNKVDRSKPYIIKPMSEINARYYTLQYKEDGDFWNDKYKKKWGETYGQRTYDNQLEFAKDKDSVQVIFSPTPLVGYTGTGHDKVYPAIYKSNNNIEEQINFNIRILLAKKITGRTSWNIYADTLTGGVPDSLGSYTTYGYAGHFDDPINPNYDINFGSVNEVFYSAFSLFGFLGTSSNLFNVYYSTYFAEITDKDSRLVTYFMKFAPKDIFNVDFGRFILIDGVLYRIDKIIDYSDGEVCKVQLLRVIYNNYY